MEKTQVRRESLWAETEVPVSTVLPFTSFTTVPALSPDPLMLTVRVRFWLPVAGDMLVMTGAAHYSMGDALHEVERQGEYNQENQTIML